jgi:ATP-dependent DNA helicase RecG
MVKQAETYVLGAMRKAVLIDGVFRREIPEYPREALREALANALAHRDYSSYVRGGYIQIRMFADRLEIQSPGGLFGNVTVENLEEEHSTRNPRLMRMMEDMHVVENRGSSIRAMLQATREANLEPPRFDDRRTSFLVTFRNHTLMNPQAIAWLNQFAHVQLNDRQRLALVYLQQHEFITNADYRRLNRVDAMVAGQELRGLVQADLIEQHGTSRWTSYVLKAAIHPTVQVAQQTDEDRILARVHEYGSINNTECRELLGVDEARAYYLLKKLSDSGRLKPTGKGRWRVYVLP